MTKTQFSKTLIASVILFTTTQGFAQDGNWAGPYFGLHFGSGAGNADTSFTDTFTSTSISESVGTTTTQNSVEQGFGDLSGDITGSIADLFVGYNFHLTPRFIFGGQLEGVFFSDVVLETTGQRFSSSISTATNGVVTSTTTSIENSTTEFHDELTSMFTFLARGGYLICPNLLVYVLGGGAEGNFVIPADFDITGEEQNKWVLGYTVGAGLEYRVNNNWSLRGEYRYINFSVDHDRSTHSVLSSDPDGPNNSFQLSSSSARDTNTDFNFNMGKIGIVYRFDVPHSFK